jgi:nucleotide-binding universal stress UspA family protein
MFKHILVPLDLSDKHQPALNVAQELARQGKGKVTLLHVIEVIPGLGLEEEKTFYERLERMARKHLERYGTSLAANQVSWEGKVVFGQRSPEVSRVAKEAGADLVVVTAPQFDPKNPGASWGSMSWKIGILAPCPVLLVK